MKRVVIERNRKFVPEKKPIKTIVKNNNYDSIEQQIKNLVKESKNQIKPSPDKNINTESAYNFGGFTKSNMRGSPGVKGDFISIYKTGVVSLSTSLTKIQNLKNTNYVNLFYDKELNCVAFKFTPTNDGTLGAYKFSNTKSCCRSFCVRSFFKHYKIDVKKSVGTYEVKMVNIPNLGEMWIIDLKNPVSNKTSM